MNKNEKKKKKMKKIENKMLRKGGGNYLAMIENVEKFEKN